LGEIFALIIPFLLSPKDYSDVLKKLTIFSWWWIYIITFFLRSNVHINSIFSRFENWGAVGDLMHLIPYYDYLNLSGVIIGLIVAILNNSFHLHNRISDLLGIRRRFDRDHILLPLANLVGAPVPPGKMATLLENRNALMRAVYYKYASSRSNNPLVDKHDIEHALAAWSWFWMFIEAAFFFTVGAMTAFIVGESGLAAGFLVAVVLFLLFAYLLRPLLSKYAEAQVRTIAADATASYEIRSHFNAL
jgi:hypothetical protein